MLTNQPKKIDKYSIHSVLGHGAMGVVYKGYDKEIDRHVAIKVLHPHLLSGEMGDELEQRFKNEVKAAAKCLHPNIVTIFDCGVSNGSPYMVMEYVQGIDLREILKSQQKFSLAQTIGMTCNVLDALYAAHEMGIVHRDIKPANILLLDTGVVKVTDFGVARIDSSDLTQIGDVIGTPSYMSPEAKAGALVDNRSDLYSAALVLFELLTFKRLKS
ncbi:MAG: serine/threonine protein kinase, partial [Methylococcales bacterium]|nr:serine/threonine protein kinase [Methylococcales bacterium]